MTEVDREEAFSFTEEYFNELINQDVNNVLPIQSISGDSLSVINNTDKNKNNRVVSLNFVATNARSLAPKMTSLIDCFTELDLHFAVVTESWLKYGLQLRQAAADLNAGCNLDIITRNRRVK